MPIIHRVREWSKMEGIFGSHLLQLPYSNGVTLEPVAQDTPRWLLAISKGGNPRISPGNLQHLFMERNYICSWKERLCSFFLTGITKVYLASVNHHLLLSLFFVFNWYWWPNGLKMQGKLILVYFTSHLKILVSKEHCLTPHKIIPCL